MSTHFISIACHLIVIHEFRHRLEVSRGTAISIGSMFRRKRGNASNGSAKKMLRFVQRIVQRWPEVCLRLPATISGTLAAMMSKWTDGAVRIWKCHSEFGNVSNRFKRILREKLMNEFFRRWHNRDDTVLPSGSHFPRISSI